MIDQEDLHRIDRRIGWIMSLGGAVLLLGQAPFFLVARADYPMWWHVGVGLLAATVLFLAGAGWALSHRVLAVCWRAAPTVGMILMLTSFLGYRGPQDPQQLPWILAFDATLSAYLMLWLTPWVAAAGTLVIAILVPVSALLFTGGIPQVVLAAMPVHMSNIGFIALFVGIRAQMIATRSAARAAAQGQARQTTARVEAEHREHVSRMLHDEVLSVLTAALRTRGAPSQELRGSAEGALALLAAPLARPSPGGEDCRAAVARLTAAAAAIDASCRVEATVTDGMIPAGVADGVLGAAREALRNSVRHAGSDARRSFVVHAAPTTLTAEIRDDGRGFVPELVPPGSFGISHSIVGRMRGLPGGAATVASQPGGPTVVTLNWRA